MRGPNELHDGITKRERSGFLVLEVDTRVAKWQGKDWKTLSDFYKQKFENRLVLTNPKQRVKILYKP